MTSVDDLCDDVLSLVFDICCRGDSFTEGHNFLHAECAPWVLSYVCRRWRVLVLSSPLLWDAIYLDMKEYYDSPRSPGLPFLLDLYLQRSGDLNLEIGIKDLTYEEEDLEDENREWLLQSFLSLLIPTTNRWSDVILNAPHDIVGGLSGCSFDSLHTLGLFPFTPLNIDTALKLRPWSGIRCLRTGINGPVWLPRMPNLEEWHLYASGVFPRKDVEKTVLGMTRLPAFDLPFLRVMTLNGTPTNAMIDQLSRCLHAPALETLGLTIGNAAPHLRFPIFASVERLSIDVGYYGEKPEPPVVHYNDSTVPLLLRSPNVTDLHLGMRSASPAALQAIRFGAVPRLKMLCLHFDTLVGYTEHVLSMLEARVLRSETPLSEFILAGYGVSGGVLSFMDAGYQERWVALGKIVSVRYISHHKTFD